MMTSFRFFADRAMTTPLASLGVSEPDDDSSPARAVEVWLGSPVPGRRIVPTDGGRTIEISVDGASLDKVRMALAQEGLVSAGYGESLSVGRSLESIKAVPVYIELDGAGLGQGDFHVDLVLDAMEESR